MIGCSDLVPLCYPCDRFFCYLCAQSVPAPPRPLRGTSPRATFSHSAIDHRSTIRHVSPWKAGIEVDWRACFHSNRSCRLVPAHQGMKSWSCGLVQRIGTADSATPHPDPSGGQAPALHLLIPPSTIGLQFGTFRPWKAGIEVDWRACFHSNRSCRLVPAHQGMKSWSCGLVQRIGTADSATPHPDPSGGQAPRLPKSSTALHFLIPPSTIGLQFGTFRPWKAGIEVD